MEAGASQRVVPARVASGKPFLAADVGGTHARVGLVYVQPDADQPVAIKKYTKYVCADYPNLAAILRDFIDSLAGVSVEEAAIACAGYALGDALINTNLPWSVSLGEIRAELGLRNLRLVNDFEAVAYATQYLQRDETTALMPNVGEPVAGPTLVVGPGTGLGAAVCIPSPHGERPVVLATEAGQAAFAPSSDREIEILRVLRRQMSHVSIEHVASGPGLVNLYAALCHLRGTPAVLRAPAAITHAALHSDDGAARETLDVFCGLMGSVLGNLVLLYGAQGGAYLAGGILPQIKDHLRVSTFVERFLDKGAMRPMLERVPVLLIEHAQMGVLGAAGWYLQQRNVQ